MFLRGINVNKSALEQIHENARNPLLSKLFDPALYSEGFSKMMFAIGDAENEKVKSDKIYKKGVEDGIKITSEKAMEKLAEHGADSAKALKKARKAAREKMGVISTEAAKELEAERLETEKKIEELHKKTVAHVVTADEFNNSFSSRGQRVESQLASTGEVIAAATDKDYAKAVLTHPVLGPAIRNVYKGSKLTEKKIETKVSTQIRNMMDGKDSELRAFFKHTPERVTKATSKFKPVTFTPAVPGMPAVTSVSSSVPTPTTPTPYTVESPPPTPPRSAPLTPTSPSPSPSPGMIIPKKLEFPTLPDTPPPPSGPPPKLFTPPTPEALTAISTVTKPTAAKSAPEFTVYDSHGGEIADILAEKDVGSTLKKMGSHVSDTDIEKAIKKLQTSSKNTRIYVGGHYLEKNIGPAPEQYTISIGGQQLSFDDMDKAASEMSALSNLYLHTFDITQATKNLNPGQTFDFKFTGGKATVRRNF